VKHLGEEFGQLICVLCVKQQQETKQLLFAWEKRIKQARKGKNVNG
jgi:hypothetical protein